MHTVDEGVRMCQNVLQSVVTDSAMCIRIIMLYINLLVMDRQSFLAQMFYVYMYDSAAFVYQFTSYQQRDNKSLRYH